MHNKIEVFWWGARVCLDESNTQTLLSAIDTGGNVAGVLMAVDPELRTKVALLVALALIKLGAGVIKSIDQAGGSQGVCISRPWIGPVGWVSPQTA